MKPFKFASCLRKPHLSSSMRSKVIQVWMKCFNFAFAISTKSLNDITLLFFELHLNALSKTDAVCVDCSWIWRASFASPIFLCFVQSLWTYKSERDKRRDQKFARKVWNPITPEHLKKLYKLPPQWVAALIQSRGAQTNYWWFYNQFVFISTSIKELMLQVGRLFFLEDSRNRTRPDTRLH